MNTVPCPNCGSPRTGSFCSACGQNDRNYQRSLPPMLWELLRETFDIDARIPQTLKLLLFKPGELAQEFSRNRRARFVSPLRLYFFISVCFFLALSWQADFDGVDIELVEPTSDAQMDEADVEENDLTILAGVLSAERMRRVQALINNPGASLQRNILLGIAQTLAEEPTPPGAIKRFLVGQFVNAVIEPRFMLNNMLDNLPVAMFVLLPVFALILKVLYFRSGKYYVEHLVFATHLHSFAFLMYGVLLVLPAGTGIAAADLVVERFGQILWAVLMLYHIIALKRYYLEGWLRTCAKFVVQMGLYGVFLLPTSAAAVLMLSLATL